MNGWMMIPQQPYAWAAHVADVKRIQLAVAAEAAAVEARAAAAEEAAAAAEDAAAREVARAAEARAAETDRLEEAHDAELKARGGG